MSPILQALQVFGLASRPQQDYGGNFKLASHLHPRSEMDGALGSRTISEIVYGSFFTLLLTTIFCVRPNIPGASASGIRVALKKLKIVAWMIVSPELIVSWAVYQYEEARRFRQKYKERGWTTVHGQFVVMGGLMLFKDGRPIQALSPDAFTNLLQAGCIDFPILSENDIQQRSSAHPLLAALVILQGTWFLIQFFSRLARKLAVTQLEIMTLLFLVVNALLKLLWWSKPLGVRETVRIDVIHPMPPRILIRPADRIGVNGDFTREMKAMQNIEAFFQADTGLANPDNNRFPTLPSLFRSTLFIIDSIVHQYAGLLMRINVDSIREGNLSVPLFYAPDGSRRGPHFFFLMNVVGSLWGTLHVAVWRAHFRTPQDALIYKACSGILIAYPAMMNLYVIMLMLVLLLLTRFPSREASVTWFGQVITYSLMVLGLVIAAGCRVVLFVEAFIALTALPAKALQVVSWTYYIPHIS